MKREHALYENEAELIARAKQGDADAFRQLVNFYEPLLRTHLTRIVDNYEVTQDLIQETLLAAYRALPRWQPAIKSATNTNSITRDDQQYYLQQHPLAPWLYQIATNFALNHLKYKPNERGHQTVPLSYNAHSFFLEERSNQNEPHSDVNLEEQYVTRELLAAALSRLSREDATCLLLRIVGGERYAEIAARLNISKEAVRKRIGRGLLALRVIYQELDMEAHG